MHRRSVFRFLGDAGINLLGAVHWIMRAAVLCCHRRRRKSIVRVLVCLQGKGEVQCQFYLF